MNSPTLLPVRLATLFITAMVGVTAVLRELKDGPAVVPAEVSRGDPKLAGILFVIGLALTVILVIVFAWAIWENTRPNRKLGSHTRWLLLAQLVAALLVDTDLLFLVAAEVGFLFPNRTGLRWMLALLIPFGAIVAAAGLGADIDIDYLNIGPRWLELCLAFLYVLGWSAFAFSVGYLAASENRLRHDLEAAQHQLAQSSRAAERLRIARELHDSLGHHLVALSLNLQLAGRLAEGKAKELVDRSLLLARLLLNDVRDTVGSLRDHQPLDLRDALLELAEQSPEPVIHLSAPGDFSVPDPAVAHAILRAVQEVVTNARRHANAANLWLELSADTAGVGFHARDDGRGAESFTRGNGMRGMEERVAGLRGHLAVDTAPGQGFAVTWWAPHPSTPAPPAQP